MRVSKTLPNEATGLSPGRGEAGLAFGQAGEGASCHSCASRNPGLLPRKRESNLISPANGKLGNMASYFLDSRLCGNDTRGLIRLGRGASLYSAEIFHPLDIPLVQE